MAGQNKNDLAWEQIFERHQILSRIDVDGFADVTADQIRAWREPRLMAKIDHKDNLPELFKNNGLSILTLSTSSYRIGPFKIFEPLPAWTLPGDGVEVLKFPENLETLDFLNLTSEPGVINAANATSMLSEFAGEQLLLTVAGRMRTSEFQFYVDSENGPAQQILVQRAQMEIDAGYEGDSKLMLFEVKNHSAKDFNMRQLYYPYRTWAERIGKEVVPVFLTFSNDVFDFYEYRFASRDNFSSAVLTRHKRYMLEHTSPKTEDLVDLAKSGLGKVNRTGAPFPQADSLGRVIDLVGILIEQPKTVDELATYYGFDPRQSDYYFNAAKFLGLAKSRSADAGTEYREATELAMTIFQMPFKQKYLEIARLVLDTDVIAQCFLKLIRGDSMGVGDIATIFENSHDSDKSPGSVEKLSDVTILRRSGTIRGWLNWLQALPG
jgi:hypothetical protein